MSAARTSRPGARSRSPRAERAGPRAVAPLLDVVCFGEILWDLFGLEGRGSRPEPIAREFRRELGGAPANVATGLARLGIRSAIVGAIGIDKLGDALERHLIADGVSTRFLVRFPNRTGITFVTRDPHGEPSFLPYRQDTADLALRQEHVTPEMARASWVLVGTSTMITPPLAAATERFLAIAEEAKANIVVDLNVREHLWASKSQMREAIAQLVRRASIVKGSFADLVALTGRRDILWLADHAPKAAWIVTQGAKGASAIGNHGFVARQARKAKCVDATGAGDAFIAGVLAVLIEAGATPETPAWKDERVWGAALEAGHAMGAKAVSRLGSVAGLEGLDEIRAIAKSVRGPGGRAKPGANANKKPKRGTTRERRA
jgi:fructokinase